MAASYPGTIKTFSTKAPGEAIASSHINDVQDEVKAIETQLITSKLATLGDAPVGNKVLTSVAGEPTWADKAPDADKLDGLNSTDFVLASGLGEWVTYTPTWTAYTGTPSLGNGTLTGRYCKVGKMVIATVSLTFGSTTSAAGTSTWYIGLPIMPAGIGHGVWEAYESGVKYYTGILQVSTGTTTIVGFYASDGQGYLSETRPHTWKANDQLTFTAIYQVA